MPSLYFHPIVFIILFIIRDEMRHAYPCPGVDIKQFFEKRGFLMPSQKDDLEPEQRIPALRVPPVMT